MHAARSLVLLAGTALAAVHKVDVGQQGLTFSPKTVTAAKGDIVIFHLYAVHDVAQSDFASPCTPSSGGFYSGSFDQSDSGKKKFVYTVNSTDPIYYYCAVEKHCQSGMVGGINVPSSGDTIDKYADAAKNVDNSESPKGVSGGELLEDSQIASITASAGASASASGSATASASGSASGSPSGTAASTTPAGSSGPSASGSGAASGASSAPSSTGAADVVALGPASGVFAAVLGFAAWLL